MSVTPSVPTSTLDNIQAKIRRITGRPDNTQISADDLNQYIQTFIVYDFPETLRLFNLKETYTFTTEPNIDSYDFRRNQYVSVQPPLYIDGIQSDWNQSRDVFYQKWPKFQFQFNAGSGDGTQNYAFQIPERPILRAQVRFNGTFDSDIAVCATDSTGATATLIDDGSGILVDTRLSLDPTPPTTPHGSGTVNYETGAFTIAFTNNIPSGNSITIFSVPFTSGRPVSILFFDDKFVLRPVPDDCYKVDIDSWINPLPILTNSGNPELNEWWQFIALGASLKVFEDNADIEEYAKFFPIYQKYEIMALRRTIVQQTNQRVHTIYENQASASSNNYSFTQGRF